MPQKEKMTIYFPLEKKDNCIYETGKRLFKEELPKQSRREILESLFLEMLNSFACILPFIYWFMLTFGFGYQKMHHWPVILPAEPIMSPTKTYFSFETKGDASHKGRALCGSQVGLLLKWLLSFNFQLLYTNSGVCETKTFWDTSSQAQHPSSKWCDLIVKVILGCAISRNRSPSNFRWVLKLRISILGQTREENRSGREKRNAQIR